MFEIRLHGALWKSATQERSAEWRRTVAELNRANTIAAGSVSLGEEPALELVRLPNQTFVLRLYADGWSRSHEFPFEPAEVQSFFDEYDATIRQMVHVDRQAPARGFEALDYAKRVVHDEAGAWLIQRLRPELELELDDARRLFTLVFLVGTDLPESLVRYHRRHGPQ